MRSTGIATAMQPSVRGPSTGATSGRPGSAGYTLIELMIVVTILGVLTSLAIPQYFDYVRDSRRADAVTSMNRMLSQQELFYSNNQSTYTDDVRDLGYDPSTGNDQALSEEGFYRIQLSACGAGLNDCVQLAATPVAGTSQVKDEACWTFNLNSRGRQIANPRGLTTNNPDCWD